MQSAGDGRRLGDILVGPGRHLPARARAPAQGAGRGSGLRAAELDRGLLPLRGRRALPRGGRGAGPVPDRGAAHGGGAADRRVVAHRLEGLAPRRGARGCRRRSSRAAIRSIWCRSSGRCSPRWTASATCAPWPTRWAARSSRWRARSSASPTPASSCWTIPAQPRRGGRSPAAISPALLVPAREAAGARASTSIAGRRARRRCCGSDPLMPEARRLLGVVPGGAGPVREALETLGRRGAGSGPAAPGEEAGAGRRWSGCDERWRRSMKELERYRD